MCIRDRTNTGVSRCVYYNSDGVSACGNTSTSGTKFNRPNARFGNCGGQNPSLFTYSWTPSTGLTSTNTYSTFATPLTTTVYTVDVSPIGQTNCMQTQSSTVTIVNPVSPTITAVSPMCTNGSPVTLTVTPTGGVWTGSGVNLSLIHI